MVQEGRAWVWIFACAATIAGGFALLGVGGTVRSPRSRSTTAVADAVADAKSLDPARAARGSRALRRAPPSALAAWLDRSRAATRRDVEVERALALLDDHRRRARGMAAVASPSPATHDAELSRRAQRHADFLALHPEIRTWPEGHQEPPKVSGASPEGDAAGRASVIAFSQASICEAIEAWTATYFHRLPILEGSLAVGWGEAGRIHVLDVGTLAVGVRGDADLRWPADGATDVPVRFDPWGERPAPAPGVDERFLGYPVTLQVSDARRLAGAEGSLRVWRSSEWVDVPCLFSSPEHPLQPLSVPNDAACLLPRRALDPGAEHEVTFRLSSGSTRVWRFRTTEAAADAERLMTLLADRTSHDLVADLLPALDSRWASATAALRYRADFPWKDSDLLQAVRARVSGEPERVEGKPIADACADARTGPRLVRVQILTALGQLLGDVGRHAADPAALADESPAARAALDCLRAALADPEPAVREEAVLALDISGTRHANWTTDLLARAADEAPVVRRAAIRALGDLYEPDARVAAALYDGLSDGDEDVRWIAAGVVGRRDGFGPRLLAVLLEGAASRSDERRVDAAKRLGRFRKEPEVKTALERLAQDDPRERVRAYAGRSLEEDSDGSK